MSPGRTAQHTVPTHLNVPDKVLTVGPLSLTARQFLLLLIGCSLGYNLWHQLPGLSLYGPAGLGIRICLALLPALAALAMALVRVAGRSLEHWFVVLLRYWWQPKCYVWRSLRHQPDLLAPELFEEVAPNEALSMPVSTAALAAQTNRRN